MKLYRRDAYLSKIRGFYHDTGLIKVITGVRRCGKSCLMETIIKELQESGIDDQHIIYLNLDKRGFRKIKTADQLDSLIEERSSAVGIKYLFIDEVQNVKDFEEVINGYREEEEYSIFITGSNSYLLSGELATKLTGRYLEFELYTLTFPEYLEMKSFLGKEVSSDLTDEFDRYLLDGGFPQALQYEGTEKRAYIAGVIREIFQKDIKKRIKIRNIAAFQSVQTYLINNFGATTSLSNLLEDMRKVGIHIKRDSHFACLDASRVTFPLTLRPIRQGDRFQPFGMKGTKLVSDYLADQKVAPADRRRQLVLTDCNGDIIWLVDRRPDGRFTVSGDTVSTLLISHIPTPDSSNP